MTVKVRKIRDSWGIVVHYRGRRKSRVIGSQARAVEVAERVRTALELYGLEAFRMLEPEIKASGPVTVADYAARYLEEIQHSRLRRSSRMHYELHVRQHIVPAFGHLALADVDYRQLKAWVIGQAKRYAHGTVRHSVSVMRCLMGEAHREGLIPANPVGGLGRFYTAARRTKPAVDPFTAEELWEIEDRIRQRFPEYWEFVLCLSRTGMRIGEVRGLEWGDIDWRSRQIHVRRNIPTVSHRQPEDTKTTAGRRRVDMSAELFAALQSLHKRRKADALALGRDVPEWVFLSGAWTPVHYSHFINRVWRRALSQTRIRYRTPHDLRHTYASHLLSAGEDLAYVAAQLGHANPGITLRVYSHWIPGRKRVGVDHLDRAKEG